MGGLFFIVFTTFFHDIPKSPSGGTPLRESHIATGAAAAAAGTEGFWKTAGHGAAEPLPRSGEGGNPGGPGVGGLNHGKKMLGKWRTTFGKGRNLGEAYLK